jgi:hypothetical protein
VRIAGTVATLPSLVADRTESGPMLVMIGAAMDAAVEAIADPQRLQTAIAA